MRADVRRARIEDRVVSQGEIGFSALAREFSVSEMTIRRDIEVLQSRGVLRRVAGGAIVSHGRGFEPPYTARALAAVDEKHNIAQAIVDRLRPRESVILDSGSSALAVARAIRDRRLGLTVITPSLLVALELVDEPETTVIVTGGAVRPGELSLIGADAQTGIGQYNCDTFVMGVAGLDAVGGASDYHREEAAVKRAAVNSAERVIVGADARKLGSVHLVTVAALEALDLVVSDGPTDDPTLVAARAAGVEVVLVCRPPDQPAVPPRS